SSASKTSQPSCFYQRRFRDGRTWIIRALIPTEFSRARLTSATAKTIAVDCNFVTFPARPCLLTYRRLFSQIPFDINPVRLQCPTQVQRLPYSCLPSQPYFGVS